MKKFLSYVFLSGFIFSAECDLVDTVSVAKEVKSTEVVTEVKGDVNEISKLTTSGEDLENKEKVPGKLWRVEEKTTFGKKGFFASSKEFFYNGYDSFKNFWLWSHLYNNVYTYVACASYCVASYFRGGLIDFQDISNVFMSLHKKGVDPVSCIFVGILLKMFPIYASLFFGSFGYICFCL